MERRNEDDTNFTIQKIRKEKLKKIFKNTKTFYSEHLLLKKMLKNTR